MKQFIPSLTLIFCCTAQAQQADVKDVQQQTGRVPVDSYRYLGNSLVCISDKPDGNLNACNRIGAIAVGDKWGAVQERLGEPTQAIRREEGIVAYVYMVQSTKNSSTSYWVIEKNEKDEKILAVQVTGDIPNAIFSSIQLADPEQKVLQILGPRYTIRDVPEIGGVMWDYAPFKITIEFVNGKVYSIRVANDS